MYVNGGRKSCEPPDPQVTCPRSMPARSSTTEMNQNMQPFCRSRQVAGGGAIELARGGYHACGRIMRSVSWRLTKWDR